MPQSQAEKRAVPNTYLLVEGRQKKENTGFQGHRPLPPVPLPLHAPPRTETGRGGLARNRLYWRVQGAGDGCIPAHFTLVVL